MSCEIVEQRTGQRPNIRVLPTREMTEEERSSLNEFRANKAHFADYRKQIVEAHPDREFLVYDGGKVAAFESLSDLFEFREQLDKRRREAAYHPHLRAKTHVGPTFRVSR